MRSVHIIFFILLLSLNPHISKAEIPSNASLIETYTGIDSLKSEKYNITLEQGKVKSESFVYQDSNKFISNKNHLSENNHWTNFSFSGEPVKINIEILSGNIGRYEVRPREKGIVVSRTGNILSFEIKEPGQFYLWESESLSEPLFIFANEIDEKPDINADDVVYWGPGVHNIGKHYRLESNTTYYISGGAYLKGSFLSEEDAENIVVRGRGIISGEKIEHGPYKKYKFDRMAMRFLGDGGDGFYVEGVTFINPGQYCIQAYGGKITTENIKAFGWWYETDGWVGGDNSILRNSFFKVFDDIVKVYFDNLLIENLTIYKQNNGAVFQFGWGNENSKNARARNIYVVKDDTIWNERTMAGNRGFINTATGREKNHIENFKVSNIRYDEDISYLLGIRSNGIYDGIVIEDMKVAGKQRFKSYLKGGNISGIEIKNVYIGKKKIDSNKSIRLRTRGNVENIKYE